MTKTILIFFLFVPLLSFAQNYPKEWFKEVPRHLAESWEILPQDAKEGEVILSKRTELGIFSNLTETPFVFEGKKFSSIEGLWQSLKYPDPEIANDPRHKLSWPFTRGQVEMMSGFEAKEAGNIANKIYKENRLKQVSWEGRFFDYKDFGSGSELHYLLIRKAMKAKLNQTRGLFSLLMRTGCLVLRPDHKLGEKDPKAYHYYRIYMDFRQERQFAPCGPR